MLGFSDLTALHVAVWCETGLPTVHSPMAIGHFDGDGGRPTY